jgi:hypothetical protein
MRKRFLLVLSLCATTGACTSLLGDFSTGSGGASDGGSDTSTAEGSADDAGDAGGDSNEGSTGTVTSVPLGTSVYLGQKATLDGTGSTPTVNQGGTYLWTVGKVPTGSTIASASLIGATSATPSFTPDVLGEYTLILEVSAFGHSQTNSANVFAVLPQVFYAQGVVADAGSSAFFAVADFDGGNAHPVVCADTAVTTVPNEIATFAAYAGRAYDFWEAPAGQPSRLAGFMMDYVTGTGYSSHLYSTTNDAGCGSGVTNLASSTFGPGRPYGSTPHFTPDGSRFAVYDDQWNIVTYPGTGMSPVNSVGSYPIKFGQAGLDPSGASALAGYVAEPPRVEWIAVHPDGGTVYELAWAGPKATGWAITTAPDQTNAPQATYMTCAGVVPRQFAILADGSVIASYRATASGPEDLVHLTVSGGQCTPSTNYTSLPSASGGVATDFDVSPDGTQIAFLEINPTTQDAGPWAQGSSQLPGGYVFVVPVVGGTPKPVSPVPAMFGPRWIGGGAWLVFTRLDGVTDGGAVGSGGTVASSVVIVPAAGGTISSVVASGDGVSSFVSTSGSGACSAAPVGRGGGAGAWGAAGLVSLVALASLRRRRRRRAMR